MSNRFSKPRTAEEWRERARLLQGRLEGLSIAELMRGTAKQGDASDHDGRGLAPVSCASLPEIPMGDGGRADPELSGTTPDQRIHVLIR